MTQIVIEDTWYVEPDELSEMLTEALSKTDIELLDADFRKFEIQTFDTFGDDPHTLAEGEATVEASVCQRELTECRVEFDVVDTVPTAPDSLSPAEVSFRVVEQQLPP